MVEINKDNKFFDNQQIRQEINKKINSESTDQNGQKVQKTDPSTNFRYTFLPQAQAQEPSQVQDSKTKPIYKQDSNFKSLDGVTNLGGIMDPNTQEIVPANIEFNPGPTDKYQVSGKEDVNITLLPEQGFTAKLVEVEGKKGLLLETPAMKGNEENGYEVDKENGKDQLFIHNPEDRNISILDRSKEEYGRVISGKELVEKITTKGGKITEADIQTLVANPKDVVRKGTVDSLIGNQVRGPFSFEYHGVLDYKGQKYEVHAIKDSDRLNGVFIRPYFEGNKLQRNNFFDPSKFTRVFDNVPEKLKEDMEGHRDFPDNVLNARYSVVFQGRF